MTISEAFFSFACPRCHTPLEPLTPDELRCPVDDLHFPRTDGIWRFLLPERASHYERFVSEYETVRQAEGRGSRDSAYYLALPYQDLTGRMETDWRIRAITFDAFLRRVVAPLEGSLSRSLHVLDLGAGNGWLSHRLAQRGHDVGAIDLSINSLDGLGAHIHYDVPFTPMQAEFDRLPLEAASVDLLVFNASFHYSEDYSKTLAEALRVLRPEGVLTILDTPIYHDASSGQQMVREREEQFQRRYGFPSNALPSENFLTYDRLQTLAEQSGLQWETYQPDYGLRWKLRPLLARLHRTREPASFLLLTARRRP